MSRGLGELLAAPPRARMLPDRDPRAGGELEAGYPEPRTRPIRRRRWRRCAGGSRGASASTAIPRAAAAWQRVARARRATATRSRRAPSRPSRDSSCRRTSTGRRRPARTPPSCTRPGHWMENARLEPDLQRFNALLARAGMVVLCYDPLGQGERRAGWHQHGQLAPLLSGFTSLGVMVAETLGAPRRAGRAGRRRRRAGSASPARPAEASSRRSPPRSTTASRRP